MRNVDEKGLSILDLNEDCQLEIMKHIIAGCNSKDPSNPSKYADMENFAMAVKSTSELLRIYHKEIYYHRELTELATDPFLSINFSELQSSFANRNEGDALWHLYANAIRNNNNISVAELSLDPSSSYLEFPEHFRLVKCALENKNSLGDLELDFKGYLLDLGHSFNIFHKLKRLTLDVRTSAETLASICQSAPLLHKLKILSTDIRGRLSDIVPHCSTLRQLTIVAKPNADGTEYAPLVELPCLIEITIQGAYKNGSMLAIFQTLKGWRRDKTSALTVIFTDVLPPSSAVKIAGANSMNLISNALEFASDRIELKTSYDFFEISRDSRPIEESLATMSLCAASFEVDWRWKRLILQRCLVSDIENLVTVLKQLNVNNLTIDIFEYKTVYPKLFKSLKPDGLFGLKSIFIQDQDESTCLMRLLDKDTIRELVKIKSIKFLKCSFVDWESVELLSQLTNLQTLDISIARDFKKTYAKALCNLLNTCSVCIFIRCYNWIIEFQKNTGIPGPINNGVNTLKIFELYRESMNELLEALAYRNFSANEELLFTSSCQDFDNIHKVSEIKTLKKLSLRLTDANGIEMLSALTELEELSITLQKNQSMINLFDRLASMESPSLQSLSLRLEQISRNEVFMISRIKSLKKLNLIVSKFASCASVTELANSNIEELEISIPRLSLKKLLSAFAERRTTRLQHLKYYRNRLDLMELAELSKHQDLSTLHILTCDSTTVPYLRQLKNLQRLVIHSSIHFRESICLIELENLVSLTVSSIDANGLSDLCNMKSLKELTIEATSTSLGGGYKACGDDLKLELLDVPISCLDELEGITGMKSLKKLFIRITNEINSEPIQPIELGQLTELESLCIRIDFIEFEWWSHILESCKNISSCTIEGVFDTKDNLVRKVHTPIKSIRDPAIQDPLLLNMILSIIPDGDEIYMLEYIDDAYVKVYYRFTDYVIN